MSRVLDAIACRARSHPDAIAISSPSGVLTYSALEAEIERTAVRLLTLQLAFRPGAPVAVMLDNGPAWIAIDLALMRLGWVSLPLPGFFTPAQCDHAMGDAGAGLLLRADDGSGSLEIAGTRVAATPLNFPAVALPVQTAKITYTSGSTGRARGVCLSVSQMEAVAASLVDVIGADYAGRHLPLLPLSILLENVAGLYATLIAGGCYDVLPPSCLGLTDPFRPDLGRLAAVIQSERATSLILVPELLRALLMVMSFMGVRFPDLKLVAVGGAKVSPQLLVQADALGLPVYEGYGLSECASVVALNTPRARRLGAVGKPLPHLCVRIAEDGEIVVGPEPFLGYTGGQAHLGPVKTGDLGRFDDDGFLRIEGRRSNTIINAYGRNIAPEWVESELLAQPEIRQAVVFGEAQPELGALIVPLNAEVGPTAIADAIARVNVNLPPYAQVRRWTLRAPFDADAGELTGNGRPRRDVLLANHRAFIEDQTQETPICHSSIA